MEVAGAASAPCRPRSARYAEKGYPNYAEPDERRQPHRTAAFMEVASSASAPCRPRSSRYAEKGYPDYAEPDERREPHRRNGGGGGGLVKKPAARSGRKRGRGTDAEATEGTVLRPILQGEEAVAQEEGRKRRMTDAAATVTAAGKVFPLIEDEGEDMASTGGGGVELGEVGGGGKSWRLRVKETLRAFSSNYLHFVQEEQRRADAVRQELKASRALKCQKPGKDGKTIPLAKQHVKRGSNGSTRGRKPKNAKSQNNGGYQEGKRPSKRPDLKALTKPFSPKQSWGKHLCGS